MSFSRRPDHDELPRAGVAFSGLSVARAVRAGDVKEFGFRELPDGEGAGARGAARGGPKNRQERPPHHLPQLKPVPLAADGEADPRLALTICVCGAQPCNKPSACFPRQPSQGCSHREAGQAACVLCAWRTCAASAHGRGQHASIDVSGASPAKAWALAPGCVTLVHTGAALGGCA
jgi:hypothetical protein